ncbi:MAG TPA: hypothetical protein VLB79_02795 [Solirubrobacterales bacterium]|nr:hypothetical protein [Solirubrobacterales bacterium]
MLTKIGSGVSYDVIFPSGEYVARTRQEGLLRPLDRSRLRNFEQAIGEAAKYAVRETVPRLADTGLRRELE